MFPRIISDIMSWTLFFAILMASLSHGVSERLPDLTDEQKNSVQDPRHNFFEWIIQKKGEPLFWDDVIPSVGVVEPLVELTEQQTAYVVKKYRVKAIPAIVKRPGFKLKNFNAATQITPNPTLLMSTSSSSVSSTQQRTSAMTTSTSKVLSSTFADTTKVSLPTTMEPSMTTSPVKTSVQMTTQLSSNASSTFTSPPTSTPSTSSSFTTSTTMALLSSPETQSSSNSVLSPSSATLSLNSPSPTPSALFPTHAHSTFSTQSSTQDVVTDSKSSSSKIAAQLLPSTLESTSKILSTNPKWTKPSDSTTRTQPSRQHILTSFVPLLSLKPSSTPQPTLITELLKQSPSASPNPPFTKHLSTKRATPSTHSVLTSVKFTSGLATPSIDLFASTSESLTQSPTKTDDELSHSSKQFSSSSSTYSTNPLESPTEQPSSTPRLLSTLLSFFTTKPFSSSYSATLTQPYSTISTPSRQETSVSSPKLSSSIISTNAPTTRKPTLLLSHSSSLSPLSSTNHRLSFSYSTSSSTVSTSDSSPLTTWSSPVSTEKTVETGDLLADSWCETERLNTSIVTPACKGRDYKTVAYIVIDGKLNQVISHVEVPMACNPDPDGPCYGEDNSCTCCLTKAAIDIVSVIIETGEMLQTSQNFAQCLCC